MPKNRLRLDFSLQTAEERLKFLESYLPTITFTLNEHETETLSDYILWGKNLEGLNAQQEGSVVIKEWAASKIDSIEGLLENPGFQESKFQSLGQTHYRTKRTVFNREEALKKASPYLQNIFNELFQQIDYTELVINYYELYTGKRKNAPRTSLLEKFNEEDREKCMDKAMSLTQRQYLQMRHHLVELRTEQYTYSDSINNTIIPHSDDKPIEELNCRFGEDIEVRPMGLFDDAPLSQKIFKYPPNPLDFTESDLKKISDWIWKPKTNSFYLDFENVDHVLALLKSYEILEYEAERDPNQLHSAAAAILRTLQFYIDRANLNELQREILDMKIKQQSNTQITKYINSKYEMTYNDNYISTIYRKKILVSIAQAAANHKLIMENIFYPENFKMCKDCGQLYLRSPEFYVRQHKAPDGFAPRCKRCSKKKREEDKLKYEIKYIVNGRDNKDGAT